tara:strand:+ start:563 stop:886 length:324 start_codon:yes stop_codon:yes gene_type:complete
MVRKTKLNSIYCSPLRRVTTSATTLGLILTKEKKMKIKEYRRKIIYKTIQDLNEFCFKNNKCKYSQMIVMAFNGILNDYLSNKENPSFNESIYNKLKQARGEINEQI